MCINDEDRKNLSHLIVHLLLHGNDLNSYFFFSPYTESQVTIGLEQTEYSVADTADYQILCAEVQSGSIDGRDIQMQFTVTDNGMYTSFVWCQVYTP